MVQDRAPAGPPVCWAAVNEGGSQSSGRSSRVTVAVWLDALDRIYPPAWAEEWDSSGLQVGDRYWPANRVLVALDPTSVVVTEARERAYQAVDRIRWPDGFCRRDIAWQAVEAERN